MKIKSQKQFYFSLNCFTPQTSLKLLVVFLGLIAFFPTSTVHAQCPMVCNDVVNVTLNSTGTALVLASVFDEGTTAGCCIDYFEVKRSGEPDSAFGPFVVFNCDDVGNGLVDVVVRGVACGGGSSICDSQALIEDKIDPVLICPQAVFIGCGPNASSPSVTGTPYVTEACGIVDLTYTDNSFSGNCGNGYIERIWTGEDESGNASTCMHILTIEDTTPLQIDFPDDFTAVACISADELDPEDLPAPFNYPVINGEDCELVFQNYEDIVFTASGNSCIKILRTWTIIDWCVYNPGSTAGLYEDVQIIKVNDNEPPTFDCPEDFTVSFWDADCDTDFSLPMPTNIDDCLPDVDVYVSGTLGSGFDFEEVGEGIYDFTYTLVDGCGNSSSCAISVTVEDGNAPDFVCLNGLSVSLMPSGMISLDADDFIQSLSDNCTSNNNIELRLGGEPEGGQDDPPLSSSLVFDCEDLGENTVAIWAGDEAGNWDYCLTYVIIQDNAEACDTDDIISIGGRVGVETGEELENIMIRLNDEHNDLEQMTDSIGDYMFDEVESGMNYTIHPEKDTLYLEGVNILDLLLLKYHILQVQALDSPYKIIAADIDNSGDVSIVDAIHLHKALLSVVDTFPNNTSWRFVKSAYEFPDSLNPFNPPFPEVIEVDSMMESMIDADFMGIKIGDLNGDAMGSAIQEVEDRSNLVFNMVDHWIEANTTNRIPIRASQYEQIFGLQTSFRFNSSNIQTINLEAGKLNIQKEDWKLDTENNLQLAWTNVSGVDIAPDDVLFYLSIELEKGEWFFDVLSTNDKEQKSIALTSNNLNEVQVDFSFAVDNDHFSTKSAFPNPFHESVILPFEIKSQNEVLLRVWDTQGKLVHQRKAIFAGGKNQWELDGKSLMKTGTYWYEISSFGIKKKGKIVYLKE